MQARVAQASAYLPGTRMPFGLQVGIDAALLVLLVAAQQTFDAQLQARKILIAPTCIAGACNVEAERQVELTAGEWQALHPMHIQAGETAVEIDHATAMARRCLEGARKRLVLD